MEDKNPLEINENFFESQPFIIKLKEGELNSELLDNIYKQSNSFQNNIENFEILKEKYNIFFIRIKNSKAMTLYKNQVSQYTICDLLDRPKKLIIDIENIKKKTLNIYTTKAYSCISSIFSENDKYIYTESKDTIELKSKDLKIPDNIIDIYLNVVNNYKNYEAIMSLNNNIKFNPLFLSANFYEIFPEVGITTNFEFIINEERKLLLKKLKLFIENEKKYYWLIGSDGIGKSITLLFFTSFIDCKVIYFNLKLYSKEVMKKEEFISFFKNDIQKFYLKYIESKEYLNGFNFYYSQNIKIIEEKMSKNSDTDVSFFWDYLNTFILSNLGENYIIVIDQYKSENYDKKFKGLNKIVQTIRNYNLKIKIILSSSINNTDTKEDFIKNLDNIYNIEDNPISLDQILEIESNNPNNEYLNIEDIEEEDNDIQFSDEDDIDNQSDCSFCQNMIIEEQKNFKRKTENYEKVKIISDSDCILDKLISKTQKDYYCSLVSGKEIYKNLLKEEEYIIAKNFNYNLKYIIKYLNLKNKESKIENEDIKNIINKFYLIESNKMKEKIEEYYKNIFKNKVKNTNYSNYFDLEFKNLCKLRSYIIEDYKLNLMDLSNELYYFPMKYLNITLFPLNTNYFSLNQDLSNYKFKIRYNNNFTRIQINCIINDIFKNVNKISLNSFGGSALGNFLEIKIDETFKDKESNKFGFYDYNCRNLFSLVQKTKNSPNTIKKHRKNEKNLMTLFFGAQYYNKIIDDIDDIKDKNYFKLNDDLYYFSQVSFTGRAFDMAVLKKAHDNTYTLFLFQVTKNKDNELKSKTIYILEAKNVLKYLKSIYSIEIDQIYLTFILPFNSVTNKFQEKLNMNGLNYIFFDLHTNKFLDKLNKKEINYLELHDSLLDDNPTVNFNDLQNLIIRNNIWEKSIIKFLNRKLKRDDLKGEEEKEEDIITTYKERQNKINKIKGDSLHKIYINELFNSNYYEQVKLVIPKDLQAKIKKEIIKDENIKLKFLNSFNIVNINEVKSMNRNLIIFNKNKKIYFYYEYVHLFKNNEFQIVNKNEILNQKEILLKNKATRAGYKKRRNYSSLKNRQISSKSKKKGKNKKSNITECFNIEINKRNYTPIEKTNIIRKKSKSIKNKKKDEETDEIMSLNTEEKSKNLKEIVLNDIKEKVVKINISDLNKEIYEGKCFCFLIMSDYYIKKFFKE